MKLRYPALLLGAAAATSIALSPAASADPASQTALSCTNISANDSQCQTPGNAQITATPGEAAVQAGQQEYPFGFFGYGSGLLFHHGGHR